MEQLGRGDRRRGSGRQPVRLTARGAVAAMVSAYTAGLLVTSWSGATVWAGAAFAGGSVLAARYADPRHLLTVAVTPPLLFSCALAAVTALTSDGGATATAAGALLTLGETAPWLFVGTAATLAVSWLRGLPRCLADLRRDLRGELARGAAQLAGPSRAPQRNPGARG